MLDEKEFLAHRVDVGNETIQPDLANRHRFLGGDPGPQDSQIAGLRRHDVHRMNAVGGKATRIAGNRGFCLGKAIDRNSRHNNAFDPGSDSRCMHHIAIGVELGRIEVAVGVDKHYRKGKSGSGKPPLIISAREAAEPQAIVQPSVPCPVLSHRLG